MANRIVGFGGSGKTGGGGGHVPTESPDSLRSRQFARVIDLVSEGEVEGLVDGLRSVYLDGTPIQNADGTNNFSGVAFTARPGTQTQEEIEGFSLVEVEQAVAVEVTAVTPVTRTLTNSNLTEARVTIGIPQLTFQDPSTGDLGGTSVDIAIDLQSNGGGFIPQVLLGLWSFEFGSGTLYTKNNVYGIGCNVLLDTVLTGAQFITFTIEYRVVGNPTWTPLRSADFTKSNNTQQPHYEEDVNGNFVLKAGSPASATFFTPDLPLNNYEIRVVKVSGTGTLGIVNGYFLTGDTKDTIRGKTTSRYQRSYRIALTGSPPWDIRVRRITADSGQANLVNKTFWDSYTEIVSVKLGYPNSAIAAIQVDASQFNSIPTRGYEIKGLKVKVPVNYDPIARTYDGTWNGTFKVAWTDNPAWCFYDLVTNKRYGLGEFVPESLVDKWTLYTIAKYCDELVPDGVGGLESRFVCNLYLQTQEEAYQVVVNMASIFRAMVWWSAGAVTLSQDSPADPIMLFTPANVIGGEFSYSGSSQRARHTVALVTWNDPKDEYKQKVEYVEDVPGIQRYGVIPTDIVAFGCTSQGQAHRLGNWLLYTERVETEVVTFRVALDGTFVYPGAVIQTSDPFRAGVRVGGRIAAAASGSITVDSSVVLSVGQTYTLHCQLPSGSIESRQVVNGSGTYTVLNLATPFSELPQVQTMWILAASNLAPEQWRVVQVTEVEKTLLEISAIEYDPNKFATVEQGLKFIDPPKSFISPILKAVENLVVTETLYQISAADVGIKVHVSWKSTESQFVVSYRRTNGNWQDISARMQSIDILDLRQDTYEFSVAAVNVIGGRSPAATLTKTLLGKTAAPSGVTGLAFDGVYLTWSPITDLDREGYVVRYRTDGGIDWNTAFSAHGQEYLSDTRLDTRDLVGGAVKFLVRARDTSKILSTVIATLDADLRPSAPTSFTFTRQPDGTREFSWSHPSPPDDLDGARIRFFLGSTSDWNAMTPLHGGILTASPYETNLLGEGTYTFAVKHVDLAGNESATATFISASLGAPRIAGAVEDVKEEPNWDYAPNVLAGTEAGASKVETTVFTGTVLTAFTLESWVYVDPTDLNCTFVALGNDATGLQGQSLVGLNAGILTGRVQQANTTVGDIVAPTKVNLADGFAHHIAFAFDHTDDVAFLYVDGYQVATTTIVANLTQITNAVRAFTSLGNGFGTVTGRQAQVRVYNRRCAAAEILSHAKWGIDTTGLQLEWRLDEGTGTTANDRSGNARNGTITAGTWATDKLFSRMGAHIDITTGWLVAHGKASWTDLPSTWSGWTQWNQTPVGDIAYLRTIDVGVVTPFVPLVSTTQDGTMTLEESHSNDAVSWTAWAVLGPLVTARYVRIRASLSGTYPKIKTMRTILSGSPVEEVIEDLNTANLTGAYRIAVGDIRLPITKTYAKIKIVRIALQSVGAGWSWEVIDKSTSPGPRIKIYNASNVLADAVIDAEVSGV